MTTMPPPVVLDPELEEALKRILPGPSGLLDFDDMTASRARMAARRPYVPPSAGVAREERLVSGPKGAPDVRVRIYRPRQAPAAGTLLPALYWIHGGGMIMGNLDGDNGRLSEYVEQLPCVAVSVEYRLAPEHPHPAPVEDCYAGLVWLAAHAGELGVDAARIAIRGATAGSGLAAGRAGRAPCLCRGVPRLRWDGAERASHPRGPRPAAGRAAAGASGLIIALRRRAERAGADSGVPESAPACDP